MLSACGTSAARLLADELEQETVGENFISFCGRPNSPSSCVLGLAPHQAPGLPEPQLR